MMMNRFCRILRQAFAVLLLTLILAGVYGEAVKSRWCFAASHDLAGLEDRAVDIEPSDGSVSVTLSESEMELLSSVRCNLLYLDENVVIHLGSDANIDADWDTGVFRDNFDGTYGYIFEFLAPTGESALSEIAVFNIEDGSITTFDE